MEQANENKPKATMAEVERRNFLEKHYLDNCGTDNLSDQLMEEWNALEQSRDWFNTEFTDPQTQKVGITDCTGEELLIPALYDEIVLCYTYEWRDTMVPVKNNGLYGFVKPDGKGTLLQPCIYKRIRKVEEWANWAVQLPDSPYWGLVDATGLLLIPCEADEIQDGGNGWIVYKKNGLWGTARIGVGIMTPAEYDDIRVEGYEEPIIFVKDGKEGRVGVTGKFFTFEEIEHLPDEEYDAQDFLWAY